jgi:hypothetical protein
LIETYGLYDDYEVINGLITFKKDENGETALHRKQREMDTEARKAEGQKY